MARDRRSENGNGWFTTKAKRLTVALLLITASGGAYATVSNVSIMGTFGEFREIALIAIRGDSLPALEAKHSVFSSMLKKEQEARYPDKSNIRTYRDQIKKIERKIKRNEQLREQYKRR